MNLCVCCNVPAESMAERTGNGHPNDGADEIREEKENKPSTGPLEATSSLEFALFPFPLSFPNICPWPLRDKDELLNRLIVVVFRTGHQIHEKLRRAEKSFAVRKNLCILSTL